MAGPLAAVLLLLPSLVSAQLTITPITWDVVGLDSNAVNTGPNTFLVGARVQNTGATAVTTVTAQFAWGSAEPLINLSGPATQTWPGLDPGARTDFYFNVEVTRDPAAHYKSRQYSITASAAGSLSVSTPAGRNLYVEKLVSQNRNSVGSFTIQGVPISAERQVTLYVGQTYDFILEGSTAPGGYEQLSLFTSFPSDSLRVESVSETFSAYPAGMPPTLDTFYADGCGWDALTRTCTGTGKYGGTVSCVFRVRAIGPSSGNLSSLIYDFSGASYHYNSDFGTSISTISVNVSSVGSVGGRLFNDVNGNGIQDGAEGGLAGVDVLVTDANSVSQTVTSDSNGDYTAAVETATATVQVVTSDPDLPAGSALTTANSPQAVTITPGSTTLASPIGYQQRGLLTGRVFRDTDGNGAQDAGEPGLASVDVLVTDAFGISGIVTTDSNGDFTSTTAAGQVTVNANDADTSLPGGARLTTGNDPQTVTVPAGGSQAAGAVGYQPTGSMTGCIFNDLNGNGIQDGGEPGLAGVDVVITDSLGTTHTVTTDAGGCYTATVPPGTTTSDIDDTDLPPGSTPTTGEDPQTYEVPEGGNGTPQTVGYQQRGTLGGRVFNDVNGNGVQDAGEPGLGNISVEVTDSLGATGVISTNSNGDYTTTVVVGSTSVDVDESDSDMPAGSVLTTANDPQSVTVSGGMSVAAAAVGYQQRGSVTGLVFNDTDGDGVLDAGEPGLADVTVVIVDSVGTTVTVSTQSDGTYAATAAAGATTVDVDESDTDLPAGSVLTTANDGQSVTVTGGSAIVVTPFGFQQQGNVTGHVFHDVNGNGAQDAGEGDLVGIKVDLTDSLGAVRTGNTDSDGNYSIVSVIGNASMDVDQADADAPVGAVVTTGNDPQNVTVSGGVSAAATAVGLQSYGTIAGRVFEDTDGSGTQDAGELGLAGIDVLVTDAFGTTRALTTDASGDYSGAVAAGSVSADVDDSDASLPGGARLTTANDPQTVTVPAGSSQSAAAVGYQPTGSLTGCIFKDVNGNGVQDSGEFGLAGVDVVITNSLGTSQTVTTDAGGCYTATIPPGTTTSDVDEESLPPGSVLTAGSDPQTYEVPEGGNGTPVLVGYQQRALVTGLVFLDHNGNGIKDGPEAGLGGVAVTISGSTGEVTTVSTQLDGTYTTSVAVGEASVNVDEADADLPAGSVLTTSNNPQLVTVIGGEGGKTTPFGFQQQGTVTGHVFNDVNGNGVQNAGESDLADITVEFTDSLSDLRTGTTDANGDFSIVSVIGNGSVSVDQSDSDAPAGAVVTTGNNPQVVTVSGGTSVSATPVGLQSYGELIGRIFEDSNGNGAEDAGESGLGSVNVLLTDAFGTTQVLMTDQSGDFAGSVAAGNVSVDVDGADTDLPGGARLTTANDPQTVIVPAGDAASARAVGYQPTGNLAGCIFNDVNGNGVQEGGEPGLAGIDVVITDSLNTTQTVTTDAGGCYTATVPAGTTTSDVFDGDLPPGSVPTTGDDPQTYEVPEGGDGTPVIVGYQQRGTVSGSVFHDGDGDGVFAASEGGLTSITVTVTDSLGSILSLSTDASGDFTTSVVVGSASVDVDTTDSDLPAGAVLTTANDPQPVTVAGGVAVASTPFGFQQRGSLTGHVFNDLNGNGFQDAGEPDLANITVDLSNADNDLLTTETDSNGDYSFVTVLGSGEVDVDETDPNAPAGAVVTTGNDPQSITIVAGTITSAQPVGMQSQAALTGRVFEDQNGNSVEDSGETGIAGITVVLTDTSGTSFVIETDLNGNYAFQAAAGPVTLDVDGRDFDLPAGATLTTGNDPQSLTIPAGSSVAASPTGYQSRGTLGGVVFSDLDGDAVRDGGEPGIGMVTVVLTGIFGTSVTVETDSSGAFSSTLPSGNATIDVDESDSDLPPGAVLTTGNDPQVGTVLGGETAEASPVGFQSYGTLSGRVFADADGDGAADGGESGLPGISVVVTEAFGTTRTLVTDSLGDFSTSVPAGLTGAAVDESDTSLPAGAVLTTGNSPQSVTVPAGASAAGSPFGFQARGTVDGLVFNDLNGDGVRADAEPGLGGIRVTVTDAAGIVASVSTGSDGRFATAIAAGQVSVDVDHLDPDLPAGAVLTTGNDPQSVAVGGGTNASAADVGFQAQGTLSGLVFEDLNGDGTLDPGEPGLSRIPVTLSYAVGTTASATTDLSGFFTAAVPAGGVSVDVDDTALFPGAALTTGNDPQTVNVPGAQLIFAGDVGYQPQGTVTGRVFLDLDRDGSENNGEPGVQGVSVLVTDQFGTTQSVETDASGDYVTSAAAGLVVLDVDDADADLPVNPVLTTANDPQAINVPAGGVSGSTPVGYNTFLVPEPDSGIVSGRVFSDPDGSGTQDAGEPGLSGISVSVTDSSGTVRTAQTNVVGDYSTTGVAGIASVNVDQSDSDLPAGSVLTTGNDPHLIVIPANDAATAEPFGFRSVGTVTGRVFSDLDGDGAQSGTEAGLNLITVLLTDAAGTTQAVSTDLNGDFSAVVSAGPVDLNADGGDANLPAGAVLTTGNDPQTVTVPAGGAVGSSPFGYQSRGVLTGRVFADINGNGTEDAGESGLAGVTVTATDSVGTQRTTQSGSSGNFSIQVATGSAAVDVDQADSDLPAPSRLTTGNDPHTVSVPAGGSIAATSFGFQHVMTLQGVVFHDVNGDGIRNAGEPGLPGVTVSLVDAAGTNSSTTTGASGEYSQTVAFGPASVNVDESDSDLPAGSVLTTGNDPQTVAAPLSGGNISASPVGFQSRGNLTGRVFLDANGNGVEENGEPGIGSIGVLVTDSLGTTRTVTTDDSGNYAVTVPAGTVSTDVDGSDSDLPGGARLTTANDRQTVNVPGGATASADSVGYQPTGTIAGAVFNDFDGDGVRGPGEPGLPNIVVTVSDSTAVSRAVTRSVQRIESDLDGNFSVVVAPGTVTLDVDESDADLPAGAWLTTGNDPQSVTVVEGQTAQTTEFGFHIRGILNGRVFLDSNGDGGQQPGEPGLAGVSVLMTDPSGTTWTATSDANGDFTSPVGAGSVTVDVDQSDPDLPAGATLTTGNDPHPVSVPAGESASASAFGFQPQGTLSGHVFNDQNGDGTAGGGEPALANISVSVTDSVGTVHPAFTDSSGNFSVSVATGLAVVDADESDVDLPAGAVLTTGNDGQTVTVAGDASIAATPFGFRSMGSVSGTVFSDLNGNGTWDGGEPGLPNVSVLLTEADGTTHSLLTGAGGDYQTSAAAGLITADVDQSDMDLPASPQLTTANDPQVVSVAGGQTGVATAVGYVAGTQEPGTGLLTGRVFEDLNGNGVQDSGEPGIAGVSVQATASDTTIWNAVTDAGGSYSITVPTGATFVDVDDSDADLPAGAALTTGNDPQTVTVAASATTSASPVGYQSRGTLSGHVFLDADGDGAQDAAEPGLANISVVVTDHLGAGRTVTTAANGNYSAVVPSGSVTADVNESDSDMPPGVVLTTGNDPQTGTVPAGATGILSSVGYQQQGTLRGRVFLDSNGNGVQDGMESGAASVNVVVTDAFGVAQTAVTDASGDYSTQASAGNVSINVDESDSDLPSGSVLTTANDPQVVVVSGGGDSAAAPTGYQPHGILTGRVFHDVNGNGVLDAGEPGLADITVLLGEFGGTSQSISTAADGSFTASVVAGPVTVDADDEDTGLMPGARLTTGNDPQVLAVPAGENASATPVGFQPTGRVFGLIFGDLDSDGYRGVNELGLADISVVLTDAFGTTQVVVTGSDGFYNAVVASGNILADVDLSDTDIPAGTVLTTANEVQVIFAPAGQVAGGSPVGFGSPTPSRANLRLTKTVNPDRVTVNSKALFTLTVTNDGPDEATSVTVTDHLPQGMRYLHGGPNCVEVGGVVTANLGNLAVGQSRSAYITVVVVSPGDYVNVAGATAHEMDPVPTDNESTTPLTVDPPLYDRDADVSVVKTMANSQVSVGSKVHFTLTVSNAGPEVATCVHLQDTLPAGLSYLTGSPGLMHLDGTVTMTIEKLGVGEIRTIMVTCLATAVGQVTNSAVVSAQQNDPVPINNSSVVPVSVRGPAGGPTVDLALTKFVTPDPQAVGGVLTYTLLVTNYGPDTATACSLTDVVPEGLIIESALASQGRTAVFGNVVVAELGSIPAGQSATVLIHVRANQEGLFCNTAVVATCDYDCNPANNAATVCSTVTFPNCPDLSPRFMTMDGVPTVSCSIEQGKYRCFMIIWTEIWNTGGVESAASRVRYYLSDDAAFDDGDTYLSYGDVPRISAGGHAMHDLRKFLPDGTPFQGRYLLAVTDARGQVAECNEENNITSYGPLDAPCPNLSPEFMTMHDQPVAVYRNGQARIIIWTAVKNTGAGPAPATSFRYYLSDDGVFDLGDTLVMNVAVPAIAAGAHFQHDIDKAVPNGVPVQGRFLLGVADVTGAADECSELDNVAVYGPLE